MQPRRVSWFVASTCVVAIASSAALALLFPEVTRSQANVAIGLACFALLAEGFTYRLPHSGGGSVALIPFIAIVVVCPHWIGVAAVFGVTTAVEVARRRPLIKGVFNTAQATAALALAILTYRVVGGQAAMFDGPLTITIEHAAAVLASALTFVLVNTVAVSGVIAMTEAVPMWHVWRANTLGTLAYYVFAAPFAYLLAWFYVRSGPIAAAFVAVPMLGVRQLYKTTLQLQQTSRELLELMVKAIEARDPYTSGHSRRVADAATIIARGIGLSAREVERVRVAALLHDIGKIDEIYAPILQKEGKLTAEEWAIMKTHPIKGAELVSTLTDLRDIVAPVRHHHEHWNGRGYPDGLSGDSIPLAARIITFADTIDALLTDRPYRRALGEADVRSEFVKNCGTQFDPTICGQVLSPQVWSELFPDPLGERRARVVQPTPSGQRAIATT